MNNNTGIWIDHKKAVIIRLGNDADEIHAVISDMEKHVSHADNTPEDRQENRFTNHLNEYYAKVASFIHDADSILILGPGEAKVELKKHLESGPNAGRVIDIKTEDKMTDRQIAAFVREHFLNSGVEYKAAKRIENYLTDRTENRLTDSPFGGPTTGSQSFAGGLNT